MASSAQGPGPKPGPQGQPQAKVKQGDIVLFCMDLSPLRTVPMLVTRVKLGQLLTGTLFCELEDRHTWWARNVSKRLPEAENLQLGVVDVRGGSDVGQWRTR